MNLVEKYSKLKSKRSKMANLWQDVERYCVGFKGNFSKPESPYAVYDDTVYRDINILVSGIYSYLTPPSSKWFVLSSLNDSSQMTQNWLSAVSETLHFLLLSSNFYQKIYEFYKDLVLYGVALLYEEGDANGFKFIEFNPNMFVFDKDSFGNVNMVIIALQMSAREVVEKFGKTSDSVMKKAKDNPNDKVDVLFAVMPNESKGKKEKPFHSTWMEKETKFVLREGGYDTFPFFVGQWETNSQTLYGSSPVIDALASVILANRITKTFWINNEKLANPPLDVPYQGYQGDIDISPGAINYRSDPNDKNRITPVITNGNINITIESLQAAKSVIDQKLFVDLFLLSKDTTMTATEVIQRSQEKLLMLGSVIGRLTNDVLTPILFRSLSLAVDNGFIKEKPEDIKMEFLSPLAKIQKSSEYQGMLMVLNVALQIAQANPSVLDNVDWDAYIRKVANLYSVDSRLLTDPDEMAQQRQQRQQVQMEQLKLQLAELQGKAMKQQAQAQLNAKKSEVLP